MKPRGKLHALLAWLAVFLCMAAIFWLSQQPSLPIPMKYPYQDKLFHGIAYFTLSLLLAHAIYPGSHKKRFALAFLIAALYGVSDEIHQAFVPGRDASAWDWMADAIGAWIGAFLYLRSKKSPGSGS